MLYIFVDKLKFFTRPMTFTKSFGYALRGVLYIALNSNDRPKLRVEEIASQLEVPKHFLGKIMKKLVQTGVLNSAKGPHGGFSLNDRTLCTSLLELATITNSITKADDCVLRLDKCDSSHPCPLHSRMLHYRKDLYDLLATTSIGELTNQEPSDYIKSIRPLQATEKS
jgi:Rrf2 family protein